MLRKLPIVGENLPCCQGERIKVEYELRYDDEGRPGLVECGTTDLYEYIQSHAASVDINNIVNQCMTGDDSVLNKVQGFYDDISGFPVKLQDVLNVNQQAIDVFKSLPIEVQEIYGGNYIDFVNNPQKIENLYKQNVDEAVENKEVISDDNSQQ